MTTPTQQTTRQLAERLREQIGKHVGRHMDCWHCALEDIAAALEAMPEADEEAKRWREEWLYLWRTAKEMKEGHAFLYPSWIEKRWTEITGTPWTPPEPERVSDEELDRLEAILGIGFSNINLTSRQEIRSVRKLIEAERERRRGKAR